MTQRPLLKRLAVRLLTTEPVIALTSRSTGWATLFMLHRFRTDELGNLGHDPAELRRMLAWLRRHRYEVLDLETLVQRLGGEGPPLHRAVGFTLDDGYFEQAEIASPLFAEFDVPVTTFLTTGFLDGQIWLWWDQVEFILTQTSHPRLLASVGDHQIALDLSTPASRSSGQQTFIELCKSVPEAEKQASIARLAALAEVEVPRDPPVGYCPMTWDQARQMERRGMRFGAQTVTHPILSRTDDEQSDHELRHSWRRCVEELERPVPVFCYPNGQPEDFGLREIAVLEDLGFLGAVTGSAGYADAKALTPPHDRFRLPRFPYSDSLRINIQFASGVERFKQRIRRLVGGVWRRAPEPLAPAADRKVECPSP